MTTPTMPDLKLTNINGVELELYDTGGPGEPVVFVHGGMGDECYAAIQEPALTNRFRVIHYHRRGWGKSTTDGLPLSVEEQAQDCRTVMKELAVELAHLAGLGPAAPIQLQTALDFPDAVHTLTLMEPALPALLAALPEFAAIGERAGPLLAAGEIEAALDIFLQEECGPDYRLAFDKTMPAGWFERWVADAGTLFQHDAVALEGWEFTEEHAARITQPVLTLAGADTRPYFRAICETLKDWFPRAENAVVPDATHCMLQTNPAGSAALLADFFARHPMPK